MVEYGRELVVQRFQISLRIWLFLLVTVGKHFVLPSDDFFCGNLADFQLTEKRQYLRADNMLLRQPCVFLQAVFHISDIQLRESLKAHIKIRGIL